MQDTLSQQAITQRLNTNLIGRQVLYYPSLPSTNDTAAAEARRGAAEGLVVVADEQTVGKGRRRRSWLSPKGAIAFSVVLHPEKDVLPSLIMMASLAVVGAIRAVTGLEAGIKWPNDIMVSGKKVCGILVETEMKGNRVAHAITGIGINVNLEAADFPASLPLATSLSRESGRAVSRLDLLADIITRLDELYPVLQSGGSVYEAWRDSLITLGREVRVISGDDIQNGVAESVNRDGSLNLRLPDGNLHRVVAVDVSLREAAD